MTTQSTLTVIPLGTGGYIPTRNRETAAILVRYQQTAILFDAGTGLSRFLEPEPFTFLSGVRDLHILLSHYHLDHVIGLTWLLKLWRNPVYLYAPTSPLVNADYREALARLTEAPLFGLPLSRFPFPVHTVPLERSEDIEIGQLKVRTIAQNHGECGSVGFRIGDAFAYVTDVDAGTQQVEFLRGVKLALLDAMYDDSDYKALASPDHGSSRTVAQVAAQANVSQLGLIHINPSYDPSRCALLLEQAREVFPSACIPDDGSIL